MSERALLRNENCIIVDLGDRINLLLGEGDWIAEEKYEYPHFSLASCHVTGKDQMEGQIL